jgi:RNA polymerase sigma factor (TIGR02999 family)
MDDRTHATVFLQQLAAGEADAASRLLPLVYDELRGIADRYFREQPGHHTLEPTALVHEAFIKLIDSRGTGWTSRQHFVAVAATAMRQILVDHARSRATLKRGGEWRVASLGGAAAPEAEEGRIDVLALHDALTELAALDERQARVVELRFFGGLTAEEAAEILGVSKTTVDNDWRAARAWLNTRLRDGAAP